MIPLMPFWLLIRREPPLCALLLHSSFFSPSPLPAQALPLGSNYLRCTYLPHPTTMVRTKTQDRTTPILSHITTATKDNALLQTRTRQRIPTTRKTQEKQTPTIATNIETPSATTHTTQTNPINPLSTQTVNQQNAKKTSNITARTTQVNHNNTNSHLTAITVEPFGTRRASYAPNPKSNNSKEKDSSSFAGPMTMLSSRKPTAPQAKPTPIPHLTTPPPSGHTRTRQGLVLGSS